MQKHSLWPQLAAIAVTISLLLASFGRAAIGGSCASNITAPCTIATAGHYRVTGDYSALSGVDGFDIGVNNATVDVSGHSITGVSSGTGMAVGSVFPGPFDNTYLMTGTFANFGGGGVCTGRSSYIAYVNSTLNSASATSNKGIYPTDGIVVGSTAVINFGDGIACVSDCTIEKSVASLNANRGFAIVIVGGLVRDNVATGNATGLAATTTTAFGENAFTGKTTNFSSGVTTNDNVCDGVSC